MFTARPHRRVGRAVMASSLLCLTLTACDGSAPHAQTSLQQMAAMAITATPEASRV